VFILLDNFIIFGFKVKPLPRKCGINIFKKLDAPSKRLVGVNLFKGLVNKGGGSRQTSVAPFLK